MSEAVGALFAINAVVIAALVRALWRLNTRMSRVEGKLGIRNGDDS